MTVTAVPDTLAAVLQPAEQPPPPAPERKPARTSRRRAVIGVAVVAVGLLGALATANVIVRVTQPDFATQATAACTAAANALTALPPTQTDTTTPAETPTADPTIATTQRQHTSDTYAAAAAQIDGLETTTRDAAAFKAVFTAAAAAYGPLVDDPTVDNITAFSELSRAAATAASRLELADCGEIWP